MIEPLVDVAASEPYRHAAVQIHLPGAALVETQSAMRMPASSIRLPDR